MSVALKQKNLPSISKEEKEQRKRAAQYAEASVGLEGFILDDEEKNRTSRFVNGEISLEEFINASGAHQEQEKTPTLRRKSIPEIGDGDFR